MLLLFLRSLRIRRPAVATLFLATINIANGLTCLGQTVTPPSPKAAAFHVYGNIPVGHSTGVPNISIPLYVIQAEGISIPITLKYHIGSLKPLEPNFSDVGWGWILDYGGRISRTINDNPDEMMNQAKEIRNSDLVNENVEADYNYLRQSEQYLLSNLGNDTEYDIFDLASIEQYGRFLINEEAGQWKPYFLEKSARKLSLEMIDGNSQTRKIINSISLLDETGFKYVFGNGATEKTSNSGNYQEYCPLSWLISSIHSNYGKELVSFSYEDLPVEVYTPKSGYISIQNDHALSMGSIAADPSDQSSTLPGATQIQTVSDDVPNVPSLAYHMKTISRINFPGGVVEFTLSSDKALIQSIAVKDSTDALLTKFNFVYENFTNLSNQYKKLKKIDVLDDQSNYLYSYQFAYENEPPSDVLLVPSGIDYWGYFRGGRGSASSDLNPQRTVNYINWNGSLPVSMHLCSSVSKGDGNRSANSYAFAYALTKITYPTGGSSQFEYELNQYNKVLNACSSSLCDYTSVTTKNGGGFRIKSITNRNFDGSFASKKRFNYEPGAINLDVTNPENFTSTTFTARFKLITTYVDPLVVPLAREYYRFRSRVLSSSLRSGLSFDGTYYDQITETQEDDQANSLGKTVYHYEHPNQTVYLPISQMWTTFHPLRAFVDSEAEGSCDIFENFKAPYQIRNFGNHQLKKIEYFHETGTGYFNNSGLMRVEELGYDLAEINFFNNLRLYNLCSYASLSPGGGPSGYTIKNDLMTQSAQNILPLYIHHNYKIVCGSYNLTSKTIRNYDLEGATTAATETYAFNEQQLPSQTTLSGNFGTLRTETYYASDDSADNMLSAPVKTSMLQKNMIGIPLVRKIFNNDVHVDGTHHKFDFIVNENNTTDYNLIRAVETSSYGNGSYAVREKFNKYNSANGMLLEEVSAQGIQIAYVWSYANKYPVLKVENASYAAVVALLTTQERIILDGNPTESQIQAIHQKLKQSLSQSMVSGFVYKPLYGITAIFDPNGKKETYTYDSGGRLKSVKDHNGNTTNDYTYWYRQD